MDAEHKRPKKHTLNATLISIDNDRLQELIRLILRIPLFNSLNDIFPLLTLTLDDTFHSDLNALPSLIPVHRVVPAHDRCNLANLLLLNEVNELLCVLGGGTWGSITSVPEEVNVDMRYFLLLGSFKESKEVADV